MGNKIKPRAIDPGKGQEGEGVGRSRREDRVGGEGITGIHSVHEELT